jgi:hypothetical protein
MMNPSLLMDLARERRRDILEDARSHRRMRRHGEPIAADDVPRLGRSALAIDARVRAKARASFETGDWVEAASRALRPHTSRV